MKAVPRIGRAMTLVEVTNCENCHRAINRVVSNEYGRGTPYEDGGTYQWSHWHSQAQECDDQDLARVSRRLR